VNPLDRERVITEKEFVMNQRMLQRWNPLAPGAWEPLALLRQATAEIERLLDGTITVRGERKKEIEEDGEGRYRLERAYGRFVRTVPLPEGVKPENVKATFKNGVLDVTAPLLAKNPAPAPLQVPIQDASADQKTTTGARRSSTINPGRRPGILFDGPALGPGRTLPRNVTVCLHSGAPQDRARRTLLFTARLMSLPVSKQVSLITPRASIGRTSRCDSGSDRG
jgi:hypothetical protein